jgi:thiosulfate/3-mercaptopyruvate sulfurtransferase
MPGPSLTSPVVSTQWLADYLGSDKLVVLDASVLPYTQPNGQSGYLSGHEQYLIEGHIPGAIFADLVDVFSDPDAALPFTHPAAAEFAIAAGSVGVDNDTTVVVYDGAAGQWASRLWWLFRTNGYDKVAVLDGGYKKWTAEERATDVGHVESVITVFATSPRPELWVSKTDVEAIVAGAASGALVCGVPPREFTGEDGHRTRLGHIPGSISAPAGRLVDRESNAFIPEDALRATFARVLDQERIVTYCAGGIAAASDALALTLLGHRNVALYDGSLNEWAADAALPLVTSTAG